MKDLGKKLDNNIDHNQKIVKDNTKSMETDGGKSPKKASEKRGEKGMEKDLRKQYKFKKIAKKLVNVESIPGSQGYEQKV